MRNRRVVLLIGDEVKLAELKFSIETRYVRTRVIQAANEEDAAKALLLEEWVDLVMLDAAGEVYRAVRVLRAIRQVPCLAFGASASGPFLVDVVVRAAEPRAELFNRMRTLMCRPRRAVGGRRGRVS